MSWLDAVRSPEHAARARKELEDRLRAEGAAQERSRIVEWLRKEAADYRERALTCLSQDAADGLARDADSCDSIADVFEGFPPATPPTKETP